MKVGWRFVLSLVTCISLIPVHSFGLYVDPFRKLRLVKRLIRTLGSDRAVGYPKDVFWRSVIPSFLKSSSDHMCQTNFAKTKDTCELINFYWTFTQSKLFCFSDRWMDNFFSKYPADKVKLSYTPVGNSDSDILICLYQRKTKHLSNTE